MTPVSGRSTNSNADSVGGKDPMPTPSDVCGSPLEAQRCVCGTVSRGLVDGVCADCRDRAKPDESAAPLCRCDRYPTPHDPALTPGHERPSMSDPLPKAPCPICGCTEGHEPTHEERELLRRRARAAFWRGFRSGLARIAFPLQVCAGFWVGYGLWAVLHVG